MFMKSRILAVCLILSPLTVLAQNGHRVYEDNALYAEAAKEKSMLTRGALAPEYHFLHNGTWYAESKEFKAGDVLYNGRLYRNVKLNIDACKNLLVVQTGVVTATVPDYVEYAVIDGQKYVNLRFQNRVENAPEGFCKVEFEGPIAFYSLVQKTISNSTGYHNGDDIGYVDPDYKAYIQMGDREVSVDTYFLYSKKFYAVKDGVCVQIRNRRKFLKLFDKETAGKLKKHASEAGLNGMDVSLDLYAKAQLAYWRANLEGRQ